MKSQLPIPRYFKPGQKATLEDMKWAYKYSAELAVLEPRTLPIFLRMERELRAMEKQIEDMERAKWVAKNYVY